MSAPSQLHRVQEPVENDGRADLPDERVYESESDANLDRSLVDSIHAAEEADNGYLRNLLVLELSAHYWHNHQ